MTDSKASLNKLPPALRVFDLVAISNCSSAHRDKCEQRQSAATQQQQ
jgi:hypothetical protein